LPDWVTSLSGPVLRICRRQSINQKTAATIINHGMLNYWMLWYMPWPSYTLGLIHMRIQIT